MKWKKFVNFVGPVRPLEIKHFGRVHTVCTESTLISHLCWKSSYLVFLKTLNNYWFGVSFFSLSFQWVCSFYIRMKFPWDAGQNSPTQVKTALNYIAFEKENSIIYSWNHTDSHAVNKSVTDQRHLQTKTSFSVGWVKIIESCFGSTPVWTHFAHATLNSVLPFEPSTMSESFWHHYNNQRSRL